MFEIPRPTGGLAGAGLRARKGQIAQIRALRAHFRASSQPLAALWIGIL